MQIENQNSSQKVTRKLIGLRFGNSISCDMNNICTYRKSHMNEKYLFNFTTKLRYHCKNCIAIYPALDLFLASCWIGFVFKIKYGPLRLKNGGRFPHNIIYSLQNLASGVKKCSSDVVFHERFPALCYNSFENAK